MMIMPDTTLDVSFLSGSIEYKWESALSLSDYCVLLHKFVPDCILIVD